MLSLSANNWWLRLVTEASLNLGFQLFQVSMTVLAIICLLRSSRGLKKKLVVEKHSTVNKAVLALLSLTLIITLTFLFPGSPLYSLIFHRNIDALMFAELRGQLTLGADIPKLIIYYKNIVIRHFIPFCVIFCALQYFHSGEHRYLFFFSVGVAVFCALIDLSKAPIVKLMLAVTLCKYSSGTLNLIGLSKAVVVGFSTLVGLYLVVMGAESGAVLVEIFERVFVVQYVGLPITIEVFSDNENYLNPLGSVGLISRIFGVEFEFFSRVTMEFANPHGFERGTAGYLSSFAPAEGYAMAGVWGFFCVLAVILFFLAFLDFWFSNTASLVWFSFYLLLVLNVPFMMMDSASSLLVNFGLIVVFIWLGLVIRFSRLKFVGG